MRLTDFLIIVIEGDSREVTVYTVFIDQRSVEVSISLRRLLNNNVKLQNKMLAGLDLFFPVPHLSLSAFGNDAKLLMCIQFSSGDVCGVTNGIFTVSI